jgi:hypothetical protein
LLSDAGKTRKPKTIVFDAKNAAARSFVIRARVSCYEGDQVSKHDYRRGDRRNEVGETFSAVG